MDVTYYQILYLNHLTSRRISTLAGVPNRRVGQNKRAGGKILKKKH